MKCNEDWFSKETVMSAWLESTSSGRPIPGRETAITLTPRQVECLFWVQQGKSSRDIGVILGVSHRIVERHVFRACQRLGVRTRVQAVVRARSLGLVGDPPERPI
jgi:DNA-binding CsgD family transcriptional regulator